MPGVQAGVGCLPEGCSCFPHRRLQPGQGTGGAWTLAPSHLGPVFQAGLVSLLLHPGSGHRWQRQVAYEVSLLTLAAGPLLWRGCHESRALWGLRAALTVCLNGLAGSGPLPARHAVCRGSWSVWVQGIL